MFNPTHLIQNRSVWAAVIFTVLGLITYAIAAPQVAALASVAAENLTTELIQIPTFLILAWLVYLITRNRPLPDLAERAPDRQTAVVELIGLVIYAVITSLVLSRFGITYHPPNFIETGIHYGPRSLIIWAITNSLVYGLVPYLFFRWRGNSNADMGLADNNWGLDLRVILIIGGIDMLLAFGYSSFLDLTPMQMLQAVPLTFLLYTLGAGIPIVMLTQAILAPRLMQLSGSAVTTTLFLAFAYASFSIWDAGTMFDGTAHAFWAIVLILVHNIGPGLIKGIITVRTGNSWAHMLGYHVLFFHSIVDAPIVTTLFRL